MTFRNRLEFCAIIVLLGFVAAAACCYWQGAYLGKSYPGSTYLFRPEDYLTKTTPRVIADAHFFSDLYGPWYQLNAGDVYHAVPNKLPYSSNYPPFLNVLLFPLAILPYPTAFAVYCAGFIAILVWFATTFVTRGSNAGLLAPLVIILLAYPVQFCFDRGNLECLPFLCTALAFDFYRRDKFNHASILLGLAAGMKILPLFFAFQFLVDRRYRQALQVLYVALGVNAISFALLPGGYMYNVIGFRNMLSVYDSNNAGYAGAIFGANLRSLSYVLSVAAFFPSSLRPLCKFAFDNYNAVAVSMLALFVLISLRHTLRLSQSVLLLMICFAVLPPTSGGYRLLYLLIALNFVVRDDYFKTPDAVVAALLCINLIPFPYWHPLVHLVLPDMKLYWVISEINAGTIFHPLALLLAFFITVYQSLRQPVIIKGLASAPQKTEFQGTAKTVANVA